MSFSKRLLLIPTVVLVFISCLPQRALDTAEGSPQSRQLRGREQGANPDMETATFALG